MTYEKNHTGFIGVLFDNAHFVTERLYILQNEICNALSLKLEIYFHTKFVDFGEKYIEESEKIFDNSSIMRRIKSLYGAHCEFTHIDIIDNEIILVYRFVNEAHNNVINELNEINENDNDDDYDDDENYDDIQYPMHITIGKILHGYDKMLFESIKESMNTKLLCEERFCIENVGLIEIINEQYQLKQKIF